LPDSLAVDDPFVTAAGYAIERAVEQQAASLYADSMAHALTTHLLCAVQSRRLDEPRTMLGAAQFSAAFRREYGCAPGQYRRAVG